MNDEQVEYLDDYFLIKENEFAGEQLHQIENIEIVYQNNQENIKQEATTSANAEKNRKRKKCVITFPNLDEKDNKNNIQETLEKKPKKSKTALSQMVLKLNDTVSLYAYKDCLGKFDSLVQNSSMPLWFREGNFLLQKLFRSSYDENGMLYVGSRVYSYWTDAEAWKYLEIKATVVEINTSFISEYPLKFKIMDIDSIERECELGNFKTLNLLPYTPGRGNTIEDDYNNNNKPESDVVEEEVQQHQDEGQSSFISEN